MMEKDTVASARLELLSNTAMLKKVLEKGVDSKERMSDERSSASTGTSRDEQLVTATPQVSSLSEQSPSPSMEANVPRYGSVSPPTGMDGSGRARQVSSGYGHPGFHPSSYTYSLGRTAAVESTPRELRSRSDLDGQVSYQGECNPEIPPHRGVYYMEHPDHQKVSQIHPQLVHPPSSFRRGGPYPVKENSHPRYPYFPGMYTEQMLNHHASGRMDLRPCPSHEQMYFPPPTGASVSEDQDDRIKPHDQLAREHQSMQDQLKEKDMVISSLQQRVNYLETQINELRQLPTGKISHIPVDDMIRIMEEYGSEVSNQTLPKRKDIKKASIVRQFRRWNPEFFRYFIHLNGEWVPKLGREGELKRRIEKRRLMKGTQNKGA